MNSKKLVNTPQGTFTREGDLIELASTSAKYFLFELKSGEQFHTHRGIVKHDELIGKEYGSIIKSHKGSDFYLLEPGISELIATTRRSTQIMYAKDIGYILLRLNIKPGSTIIEAGTGSGGFTQILATYVGERGSVYSYEIREEMQNLAKKNVKRLELSERVTFYHQDIAAGFKQKDVDSVFLDIPNPFDYLEQVKYSLKPGGFFGALVPTTNQVAKLLVSLDRHGFCFIDVCEIMLRFYQSAPNKFRPVDRMVAHTGYLIFARSVIEKSPKEEQCSAGGDL